MINKKQQICFSMLNDRSPGGKIRRRKFIKDSARATAAIGLSPLLLRCNRPRKQPNIVYVFADQWRASATGYAGDPNVKTPHLDKLSKESFNFRNARSVCPVCTPYRAALMTGRYPTSTGMFLNNAHLPDNEVCISEILRAAGYNTGYIGKWHLDGHGRMDFIPSERRRGFVYWKVAECDHNYNHSHYYAGNSDKMLHWQGYDVFAQTKDAQQFIRKNANAEKPFALVISYGPPHRPHATAPEVYKDHYPPETLRLAENVPSSMEELARKEIQGYYGHCEAIDASVGDLLAEIDAAGIKEDTLFVFTADHGEMLGSHGVSPGMKQVPWAEASGVPFLLRYPAIHGGEGRTMEMPLTTPDISATLLGLAGLEVPRTFEGDDLSERLRKGKDKANHAVLYMGVAPFSMAKEWRTAYRAVKTNRHTYVCSLEGPWLLYDDTSDPFQMNNLVDQPEYASLRNELDDRLQELLKKTGDDFRPPSYYIAEWGYEVNPDRGSIPYQRSSENPQTPKRKKF
jgi:arylsulfatase A-like enzyme